MPQVPTRRSDDQWREGEVSLRQLYLTFKAGLVAILLVMLVCAVAAYLVVGSRGSSYPTSATVIVTPPPVGSSSLSGLELTLPTGLDFDTYKAIAFEPSLVEKLADAHGEDAGELLGRMALVSRAPASQARGHLTVEHQVNGSSSGVTGPLAATLANEWADATTARVTEFLTGPIDQALSAVTAETEARKAEFDAASSAWSEFLGVDERRDLNASLDALAELGNAQRTRLADLESAVASSEARASALQAELAEVAARSSSDLSGTAQLLEEQLAVLMGERAALRAERDHLVEVKRSTTSEAEALRLRLTDLESRASTLQRDLAAASMTFYRVAPVAPTLQLQRDLVAHSVKVAVKAAAPLVPEAQSKLVFAVAAAALGGLLATLFVFLRAAVRDPEG